MKGDFMFLKTYIAAFALVLSGSAFAKDITVDMYEALDSGNGASKGTITISQTPYGLLFTPNLTGLPANQHGFHIHENPDCSPGKQQDKIVPALAAGGHYDPLKSGKHLGPYTKGHLGDLPALVVNSDGTATYALLAPRLKSLDKIKGRSLMIHIGADNYADMPDKLGGGGARMICGIIK